MKIGVKLLIQFARTQIGIIIYFVETEKYLKPSWFGLPLLLNKNIYLTKFNFKTLKK